MSRPAGFTQGERQREAARVANTTHGKTRSAAYISWQNMRQRCTNSQHPDYPNYGGRGISVCTRWTSFEAFYFDMGDRPKGLTLERNNTNLGYSPDNCRWATPTEQSRNRRNNLYITHEGETLLLADWSRRLSIDAGTLRREWLRNGSLAPSIKQRNLK